MGCTFTPCREGNREEGGAPPPLDLRRANAANELHADGTPSGRQTERARRGPHRAGRGGHSSSSLCSDYGFSSKNAPSTENTTDARASGAERGPGGLRPPHPITWQHLEPKDGTSPQHTCPLAVSRDAAVNLNHNLPIPTLIPISGGTRRLHLHEIFFQGCTHGIRRFPG